MNGGGTVWGRRPGVKSPNMRLVLDLGGSLSRETGPLLRVEVRGMGWSGAPHRQLVRTRAGFHRAAKEQ